jgi:hypothetical protein
MALRENGKMRGGFVAGLVGEGSRLLEVTAQKRIQPSLT